MFKNLNFASEAKKISFTKIVLSVKLISCNNFNLKSFQQTDLNSKEGGKSFLPEPQKHTEHFCYRK
jgi:hypothetical protein